MTTVKRIALTTFLVFATATAFSLPVYLGLSLFHRDERVSHEATIEAPSTHTDRPAFNYSFEPSPQVPTADEYLAMIDNPKPPADFIWSDPEHWAGFLSGESLAVFCSMKQAMLAGQIRADDPVSNRTFAKSLLRQTLNRAITSASISDDQLDLMLDAVKSHCQENGCDCEKVLKEIRERDSPY